MRPVTGDPSAPTGEHYDWTGTGIDFDNWKQCELHVRYTLRRITDSDVRTLRDISCIP
jgi:hypothetical protein